MGNFVGSITAIIGANTGDYKKAMSEIASLTSKTMNDVSNNMSNSTNSIVAKVGSIMGQLSSSVPAKLSGLKTSLVEPFNTAGGQIQRVIASIGEKIPGPFKSGFSKVGTFAKDAVSLAGSSLQKLVTKSALVGNSIGDKLANGFNKAGTKAANALNGIINKTNGATSSTDSFIKKAIGIGAAYAVAQKATSALAGGITGLIGDLNQGSATWKTFNSNMQNIGKGKDEIAGVKKELQDFATKTIYSASDMATTYSQLAAVGIKNTDKLVMGFGGLAAAAEDPTQAMKTLSQQATQMAAKPMVQWQDFKLMLEQTPAGIAAVAKEMGMSTAEMVTAVQDGTIKTEDFFDAITKVGTNDAFSKMATQYKTVGQAMDGFRETLTNKLQPAFDKLSQVGIDAISKITDKIGDFNMDGMEKAIDSVVNILNHFINGTEMSAEATGMLQAGIQKILPVAGLLGGALTLGSALPTLSKIGGFLPKISGGYSEAAQAAIDLAEKTKEPVKPLTGFYGMIQKSGNGISSLREKISGMISMIPGIGGSLSSAADVGMGALGNMTSAMGTIMQVALAAVGPAAILGLVVAGLGLVNNQFGTQIDQLLNMVTTKGPEVITRFVSGITSQIPQLITSGTELISKLANTIATMLPLIVQAGVDVIGSLVGGVAQNLPSLISSALTIITTILTSLASALPQLIVMGMNLLLSLVNGIIQNIPQIVSSVQTILQTFVGNIVSNLPQIIRTGIQILLNLINGITQLLPQLLPVALQAILTLISGLMANIPQLLNGAIQIVQALCNFIVQNLPMILQAAIQIIMAIVNGLVQNLPQIISAGIQIITSLVATVVQMLPQIVAAGLQIIVSLASAILQAIPNVLQGAWDGIKNGFSNLWDTITGKSKETSSKVATDSTTTANSMGSAYSQANLNVTGSMSEMSANVISLSTMSSNNAINAAANANAQASSNYNSMNTSVSGSTASMASAVGSNTGKASSDASTNASTANANVSKDFQSLYGNVNQTTSNAATAVGKNMAQANTVATNASNNMSKNVTANAQKTNTGSSKEVAAMARSVGMSMNNMEQTTSSAMNRTVNIINKGFSSVSKAASSSLNNAAQTLRSGMNSMNSALSNGMGSMISTAHNISGQIISVFRGLGSNLVTVGYNAGIGLNNGLWRSAGTIYNTANSIARNVARTIQSALDIHSPSRLTRWMGEMTGKGLGLGMASMNGYIEKNASEYADIIAGQRYQAEATMTGDTTFSTNSLNTISHEMDDDIKNSTLREEQIVVHNEIVGDKIYTTVKRKEAREEIRQKYFD